MRTDGGPSPPYGRKSHDPPGPPHGAIRSSPPCSPARIRSPSDRTALDVFPPGPKMNIESNRSLFILERRMATRLEPAPRQRTPGLPAPDGPRGHWLMGCVGAMQADP